MRAGMRWSVAIALGLVTALAACGDPPSGTDGGADAGALVLDAGIDAGPPQRADAPGMCRPCRDDTDCVERGICLVFEDGSSGCGIPCASDDECLDLTVPARCAAPVEGVPETVCVPSEGTCVEAPRPSSGARCAADEQCASAPHDACLAGVCADACETDAECPAAYPRCEDGRCFAGSPRLACAGDDDCGGTFDRCVDGLDARGAICTTGCESDADCPFLASHCVATAGGSFCASDAPSSLDACEAMIASGALEACGDGGTCPSGARCFVEGELAVCLPEASGGSCPAGHALVGAACAPLVPGGSALVPACSCALGPEGTMLDDALAAIDRDRCDVAFPTATFRRLYEENDWLASIAQDPFRLRATDAMHADWLAVPAIARGIAARVDGATGSMSEPIAELAELADARFEREASAEPAGPLGDELEALIAATGDTPDRTDIDARLAPIPEATRARLAPLVRAVRLAVLAREAALARFGAGDRRTLYALAPSLHLPGGATSPTPTWIRGALRGDVELPRMAEAAWRIAREVEALAAVASTLELSPLVLETRAGRIAIGSAGADRYDATTWASVLLLIEPGGEDVYEAPVGATASIDNGVSVAIDLGGADRYGYFAVPAEGDLGPEGHARLPSDESGRAAGAAPWSRSDRARQGAGRLGIGLLFDLGVARDEYRSLRMSQGYGALGVGMLWDAGGDDLYHGEAGVQGAAAFGIGILIDRDGDDSYVAYNSAQGFAYARAVALLHDERGNDTYFTHPSDVLYHSPQDPGGSNTSFSQGAGFGRRADGSDGVFMSGGIGILRDRAGADRYTTGIFGLATGYWFGAGFLLEGGGDDHYDGQWYVQAGDAHYAIAALIDESGHDDYNALARRMNAALGGGHDYSVAWLVDREGDDTWRGPGLAFGVGHAGGFGGFVDAAGTDSYETYSQLTFGNASIETPGDALRRLTGSVGVFLERGGIDVYVRPTVEPVAGDATWTQEAHAGENEHGVGIDRATGDVGLPGTMF